MTIRLKPEDEQLIRKRLEAGGFSSAEDGIHRALESFDAQEAWLEKNRTTIHEQIERGVAQLDRGEGLTGEDSLAQLEAKKAAWRAKHRPT